MDHSEHKMHQGNTGKQPISTSSVFSGYWLNKQELYYTYGERPIFVANLVQFVIDPRKFTSTSVICDSEWNNMRQA